MAVLALVGPNDLVHDEFSSDRHRVIFVEKEPVNFRKARNLNILGVEVLLQALGRAVLFLFLLLLLFLLGEDSGRKKRHGENYGRCEQACLEAGHFTI